MSWPHPSALGQQQRILAGQSRFPPARSRDEDNSSVLSWNTAQNEADDPADGEDPLLVNEGMVSMGINRLDPISEAPGASQSATTAPALQAARNFVDHTNETPVDRKLRKAARTGSQEGQERSSLGPAGRSQCHQRGAPKPHPAGGIRNRREVHPHP